VVGDNGATFRVVVTNSAGSVTSSAATLTVTAANTAPTITNAAGASANPVTGTTVDLSALAADDGGAANLLYTWATTGTPPAAVTFSANGTNAARNTTVTLTRAGTYNFRVTVRDAQGLTVTSSVAVQVNQTLTTLIISPSLQSVQTNASFTFTASGKDQFNVNMTAQPTVAWSVDSGGSIDNGGKFTAGASAGGPHTITATSGGKSDTAQVTVTSTANNLPTVSITSPANNTTVTAPATVSLNATASDTDGTITKVEFFKDGVKQGQDTSSPYSLSLNLTTPGDYTLTAIATDSSGGTRTSAAVVISVLTQANDVPVADAGEDQTVVWPAPAELVGRVTDGSTSVTMNWKQMSGPGTVTFSNLADLETTAMFPGPGVYTLRLTADDGQYTDTDDVTITVQEPAAVAPTQTYPPLKNMINPGNKTIEVYCKEGRVDIFSARGGTKVRSMPCSSDKAVWDSDNDKGEPVSSGIYFYFLNSKKMKISVLR
jgi:hypothetical protein